MGGSIAKVVKEIAAGSDANAVNFVFLWAAVNGVAGVSDFLVSGDVAFVYPFKDIHAIDVTIALEESRKFVDTRRIPAFMYFCDWVLDKFLPRCKLAEGIILYFTTSKGITNVVFGGGSSTG